MPKSGDGLTAHPALSFWQRRERVLSKAADEKRKLTANYLNGLGVAAAAVGVLSPAITYLSTTRRLRLIRSPPSRLFVYC